MNNEPKYYRFEKGKTSVRFQLDLPIEVILQAMDKGIKFIHNGVTIKSKIQSFQIFDGGYVVIYPKGQYNGLGFGSEEFKNKWWINNETQV